MEIIEIISLLVIVFTVFCYAHKQSLGSIKRDCMIAEQLATMITIMYAHEVRLKALDNGKYYRSAIDSVMEEWEQEWEKIKDKLN